MHEITFHTRRNHNKLQFVLLIILYVLYSTGNGTVGMGSYSAKRASSAVSSRRNNTRQDNGRQSIMGWRENCYHYVQVRTGTWFVGTICDKLFNNSFHFIGYPPLILVMWLHARNLSSVLFHFCLQFYSRVMFSHRLQTDTFRLRLGTE